MSPIFDLDRAARYPIELHGLYRAICGHDHQLEQRNSTGLADKSQPIGRLYLVFARTVRSGCVVTSALRLAT